jgi:diacylglycerol kinase (ATP)
VTARPRALLVVNPWARRAAAARSTAVLDVLARRFDMEVIAPATADAFGAAVRCAADTGAAAVIAAGGDGTLRLAAGALAGRDCALGVLPAGTANDAARALGIPRDVVAAAAHLAAARGRHVDLLEAGEGERRACWLTVGGLGVVSAAALRATALRAGPAWARAAARAAGPGVYRMAATLALLSPDARARRYAVSYLTPGGVRRDEVLTAHGAFVANLPYCGGGLRVPGAGAPDDGTFELCFVTAAARPVLAARFARLAAGLRVPAGAVRVIPAREAHVVADAADALVGDGEHLGAGRVFHFRARPRALRVLASAGPAASRPGTAPASGRSARLTSA